jgi:hypothetical protein
MSALCFWHPVGPHGAESLADILARKQGEIRQHGFTPSCAET